MLTQILESINIGLVTLDAEFRTRYWNKWMQQCTNMDSKLIEGSVIFDFFPNLNNPRFIRRAKSSMKFGEIWQFSQKLHNYLFPIKLTGSDGIALMQQSCSMGPVYGEGNVIEAIYITVTDVTDIVAYERKLMEALHDKDMLMREVHHRVKNNLAVIQSLLRLQLKDIADDKSREYFMDAENRVKSMTMIHEMLHEADDITRLSTSGYVLKLVETLFHNYKVQHHIKLEYDIQHIELDVDTIIPLGLIINELVSNALKYAFPNETEGELRISLKRKGEGNYELIIKDTGAGLPEGFDLNKTKSLGLLIVKSLVNQLQGTLEASSKGGAEFRMVFTDKTVA
ncbi:MAG: PAS domain-containing protein [Thermodesulfovibrionales bacterium]|nr:PAS domain-containing protein [Thermodesulfovibrionales bacterium]